MMRFEKIGSLGLTEPQVGSVTSGGMTTTFRREGDEWALNGEKKWIGNATFADINVIWACDQRMQSKVLWSGRTIPAMMLRRAQVQVQRQMLGEYASLAKAYTTVKCRETVGYARERLGGDGHPAGEPCRLFRCRRRGHLLL